MELDYVVRLPNIELIFLMVTSMNLLGCSSREISVESQENPAEEAEPQAQPEQRSTPLPPGRAQFTISRSSTITVGLEGEIEVYGEFPIDIYFTEGEEIGSEIFFCRRIV